MKKRKILTGVLIASACLLTIGLVGQVSQNNGWFDGIGQEKVEDEYIEYKFKIVDPVLLNDGTSLSFKYDSSFDEKSVCFDFEEIKYCTFSSNLDLSSLNQGIFDFKNHSSIIVNEEYYEFNSHFRDFTFVVCFDHDGESYTDVTITGENVQFVQSVFENTEWTLRLYK